LGFWQNLLGSMGAGALFGGKRVAGDYPPVGPVGGPRTAATANITFDDTNALTTATNNNFLHIHPGTNISIQPGALGGEATIRMETHQDDRTMDRLFVFDNGGGTADNAISTWNSGTTTATIQDLRIAEFDYRYQETARAAGRLIQGRIQDHLNQQINQQFDNHQLDAQRYAFEADRYAAQIQGQPQQRYNTDNYQNALDNRAGQAQWNDYNRGAAQLADIYRPFGGGLQGQARHPEPPNLETPRAIAEVRGNNLLKNIIGDVLYHHYEKKGYVDLPSIQKPGVGFRLRAHRRIGLLKKNKLGQWVEQKESLCIHAAGGYWVEGDQVGIHYMLCQCDETKLWEQAIVHQVAA